MSLCHVEARTRARRAATCLQCHRDVADVDILDPATGPTERWSLEIALVSAGVEHGVLDLLGSYQLTLRDASPQGERWRAVVVA